MSQTDVLVELIRHATAGNQPAIRQSVERLIADEEQKGHRILAERLQKALQAAHTPSRTSPSPFSGQGGVAPQQALYYDDLICGKRDFLRSLSAEEVQRFQMDFQVSLLPVGDQWLCTWHDEGGQQHVLARGDSEERAVSKARFTLGS